MNALPFQMRKRTPLVLILYAIYTYYSSLSLRRAARGLAPFIKRSHESIWRWIQGYAPLLDGALSPDPGEVRAIFVDETFIKVGGRDALIWVAFEPYLKRILGFHVSWRGNSIDAYRFVLELVRRYGRKPVFTDAAGWYADACRWVGVDHYVYGRPLKNLIERLNQYVKDRTEAFDDLFPCRRDDVRMCLGHVASWMALYSFLYNAAFSTTAPARTSDDPEFLVAISLMLDALSREVG